MPGVWAQLKQDLRNPVVVASVFVLTIFLVVSGPFGSYLTLNFVQRLLLWVPVGLVGYLCALLVAHLTQPLCQNLSERDTVSLNALFSALAMALPLFWLVQRFAAPPWTGASGLVEVTLLMFFVNLAICGLRSTSQNPELLTAPANALSDQPQVSQRLPGFISRLPAEIQAPVTMITGRNHHIDVTTDRGSATLLLRFSDAILLMEPGEGMQVHRSYWVAFRRMRCMEKIGQRHFLVLDHGEKVPISKNHVDTLRKHLKLPRIDSMPIPMAEAAE